EQPRDHTGKKSERALEHVRECLTSGGAALVTCPVGYNPGLDRILLEGPHPFDRVDFLRRQNWENDWTQVRREEVGRPVYGTWELGDWRNADRALPKGVFPWTNVLAVAQIRP
ncbi:MAG: hypothetical protein L3J97_02100, partial [Thermoplasmata archaeon]|nr:hypothetical protein [Thermoplasmata archaeon]